MYFVHCAVAGNTKGTNLKGIHNSLAAIYEHFTAEEIGCKVNRLWNFKVKAGHPYIGKKCRISKEPVFSKKRSSAKKL